MIKRMMACLLVLCLILSFSSGVFAADGAETGGGPRPGAAEGEAFASSAAFPAAPDPGPLAGADPDTAELMAVIVASGTCGAANAGDLLWTLDEEGVFTLRGSGAMADYTNTNFGNSNYRTTAPWYPYASQIKSVVIPEGVTHIGDCAFYWYFNNPNDSSAPYSFENITSVTLPEGLLSIGIRSFQHCIGLSGIHIPDTVTSIGERAFRNCTSLADLTIPEGVTAIGAYAFADGSALTSLTLPEGVTSIGESAFASCPELTVRVYEGSYGETYCLRNNVRHEVIGSSGPRLIASGTCGAANAGDLLWTLDEEGVFTLRGSGAMADYTNTDSGNYNYRTTAPWYPYASQIKSVVIPSGVTHIGNDAFYWHFNNPNESSAPYSFENITSLTLPEGLLSVGAYSFSDCSGLSSIRIPDTVTTIGERALSRCYGAAEIVLPAALTAIEVRTFWNDTSLTSLTIPEGVTSIGEGAFDGCSALTSLTLPEGVTSIGESAFASCPELTVRVYEGSYGETYCLENNVRHEVIGSSGPRLIASGTCGAANAGDLLWTLDEEGVFTLRGSGAMADYTNTDSGNYNYRTTAPWYPYASQIKSVVIPSGVTHIGNDAFYWHFNNPNESSAPYSFENITSLTLPEGLLSVGAYSFSDCSGLSSIRIPDTVTTIGERALSRCYGAAEIVLPAALTAIEVRTFWNDTSLTSLTIPEGVSSIGEGAFNGCSALTSLTLSAGVSSIGESAFASCPELTVRVYEGSYGETYCLRNNVRHEVIGSSGPRLIASGTCGAANAGDLLWTLDEEGVFTLRGSGAMADYTNTDSGNYNYRTTAPWYPYASQIKSVVIPSGVTHIGNDAFYWHFNNPNESSAPYSFENITSLTLPEGLLSVGAYSFSDCSGLSSIRIPDTVTTIGERALSRCYGAAEIVLPAALTAIEVRTFWNDTSLTSLTIPEGVSSIGEGAFNGCSALTSLTIPEGVSSIGEGAFDGCSALTSLTLPEGVSSIGESAFASCPELTVRVYEGSYGENYCLRNNVRHEVIGGSGPRLIASGTCGAANAADLLWTLDEEGVFTLHGSGAMADYETKSLSQNGTTYYRTTAPWYDYAAQIKRVVIPEGVTRIGVCAFYSRGLANGVIPFGNLSSVVLPESLETIGKMAFFRCEGVESLRIPDAVTSIGEYAFRSCSGLGELILPEGLSTIGEYAFANCSALTDLRLPEGVTTLGAHAFDSCSALTSLTLPEGVSSIGESAFANCPELTVRVYEGSYGETYCLVNNVRHETLTENVTGLLLSQSTLTLLPGETALLKPVPVPENGALRGLAWLSTNPAAAAVSNGLVTAVAPGTSYIAVTANGELTASCTVTVLTPVAVTGVTLEPVSLILETGETAQLTAGLLPASATDRALTWRSSDPAVAAVDQNGLVTKHADGIAVITVTTRDGGFTADCTVGTPVRAAGLSLNKNAVLLPVGGRETVIAQAAPQGAPTGTVLWNSTNPAVASVSGGAITAVAPGTATVIAIMGSFTAVCTVTVTEADFVRVTGVSLNIDSIVNMEIGSSRMLSAEVAPADAANRSLRYSSSDPAVAAVSTGGVVTAVGPGSAVITVTTDDGGFTDTCAVTVAARRAIASISASLPDNAGVTVAGSPPNLAGLTVTATYTDGSSAALTEYTVSVPEITEPGTYTATVAVEDPEDPNRTHTAEFQITAVARTMRGLAVAQQPTKRSYLRGEALDPSGLRVTAEYNDGSVTELLDTEYSLTGYDAAVLGSQTVTVRCGSCTAEFSVTVRAEGAAGTVEAPRISIASFPGGKLVELTGAEGAEIRYTLDGGEPGPASALYEGPIPLTETTTVRAAVYLNGAASAAVSARVSVQAASAPEASHESGLQLPSGTAVTLRSETVGATIYYTTDGTEPTVNSLRYGSSILVTGDVTIKAVAVKDGCRNSEVTELRYTVPASESKTAVISLGAVSGKAGDLLSLPAYIFAEEAVTEFRFTLRYDPALFECRSVTPGEGMEASALFWAPDAARGTVTVMYSGAALETSELFTLNLLALESGEDGTYPVSVSEDANLTVRTEGNAALMFSVSSGEITLEGSRNSGLLRGTVSFEAGGETVTAAAEIRDREEFTANVELEAAPEQAGTMVNVYLAIYNRRGAMVSLDTWEVEISNLGVAFMQTVRIPRNVDVGAVKLILLSDGNLPMMTAGIL